MIMARAHLVDPSVTRWYHCVTRCLRHAFRLSETPVEREEWIERRLKELTQIFAISVCGFSVEEACEHRLPARTALVVEWRFAESGASR
jgi:hypothetical protein